MTSTDLLKPIDFLRATSWRSQVRFLSPALKFLRTLNRHVWGASAMAFGVWEAVAYSTRRIPTVSCVVWRMLGCRNRRLTQVLVVGYAAGLSKHLLTPER